MKYYQIINNKIELTKGGRNALEILGISLEELKSFPDKMLSEDYWDGCKTYVDQALKNGKGITWLDNCRIPYENSGNVASNPKLRSEQGLSHKQSKDDNSSNYKVKKQESEFSPDNKGRFPANLLCSDDVLNDGKITKSPSGKVKRQPRKGQVFTGQSCGFKSENLTEAGKGDSGSYSRYFDLDAWFRERIKQLPPEVQEVFPYLICPKASKREKNKGLLGSYLLKKDTPIEIIKEIEESLCQD